MIGCDFRTWRQKIGCVLLGVAVVFLISWLRSRYVLDCATVVYQGRFVYVFSDRFGIWWDYETPRQLERIDEQTLKLNWHFYSVPQEPVSSASPDFDYDTRVVYELCGIHYASGFTRHNGTVYDETTRIIPYWALVIPLTLISTLLLLSRRPTGAAGKPIQPPDCENR